MTKIELNEKLAKLYGIEKLRISFEDDGERPAPIIVKILLIDDWSRLMNLAVDNKVFDIFECRQTDSYFSLRNRENFQNLQIFMNKEHESPQAATKYAIAMALVKLKEGKCDD